MAAMWAGQAGASRGVALEYRTPETVAAPLTVTLELPCDQMRLIWASVHDATLPEMSREEMDRFHRVLAAEANSAVGLPLGALDLSRLVTPLATVYADGRIRFSSGEAMDRCLSFLRQLAREFFDA
ncbi:uncharacterized protein LOC119105958 [Pollicipes pollicipes]|uniref:uncharacterized protein LOC119105958 n=1 Tax=Pollicipes pollicipes TaxID=41117 RepID=UPI0018854C49|nr:uncharacterized protein LOC119105958 [Pollicipes pollicipes]